MNKTKLLLLSLLIWPLWQVQSQDFSKKTSLGASSLFIQSLKGSGPSPNQRAVKHIDIPLPNGLGMLHASVDVVRTHGKTEVFSGKILNQASLFYVSATNGNVEGNIVLKDKNQAFKIYSDANQNTLVQEVDIDEVLCISYGSSNAKAPLTAQALPPGVSETNLQSYPSAAAVIYLDFNGQYVPAGRWGAAIDALPSSMTADEIYEAWQLVSEDYRPFKINVTTNETVFNNAPVTSRMRVIFTPTNTASPGNGGIAIIGSFGYTDDTPCWVFISGGKYAGEAASHETGHTFGLAHDGKIGVNEYYSGHNNWAPIMGLSYDVALGQWSKGEYQSPTNTNDDLLNISNRVAYRTDLTGNTPASAVALTVGATGVILPELNKGVIETRTDVDVFKFTQSTAGTVSLFANPSSKHPNLDILMTLKDANQNVLSTSNSPDFLSASISLTLQPGTYYVFIDGTGKGTPYTDYSDYASLGEYFISGSIPVASTNLALNKPASSSSVQGGNGALNAVDGNTGSRWESISADPQWIVVDLQQTYSINRVKIVWEPAYGKDYTIQTSNTNNGTDWATIKTVTNNTVLTNDWTGLTGSGRYIRIRGTARGTGWGYSIFELEVYGGSGNQLPVIVFQLPSNNATYTANSTVSIVATGHDPDGSIAKVEFYVGTTKLGEDFTVPYTYSWTNVPSGSYTIVARAIDNQSAVSEASVSVTVTGPPNSLPNIQVTAPANGSTFPFPTSVNITANATDSDGQISKVEFYRGTTKLGEDLTAPYSYYYTNPAVGSYTITARAIDNQLASTDATVSFSITGTPNNSAPTTQIISPTNGSVHASPASLTIMASASDTDGSILKVEFYNGATKIGQATSGYLFTWTNVPTGTYTLTTVATDNQGGTGTSQPVTITVGTAASVNLALNKPATSSTALGGNTALLAVDGNGGSRWESLSADPQWMTVDLQQVYSINRVKIVWETALGKDYKIQTSNTNNGTDWADIKTITNNSTLNNDWTGLSGSGRYLRIYGTARGTGYGYSIFELEVYGTLTAATALKENAEPSVFPNPVQGLLTVDFSSEAAIAETAEVQLMDQYLQILASSTKAAGASSITINTSSQQAGVYLLKIASKESSVIKRILITK